MPTLALLSPSNFSGHSYDHLNAGKNRTQRYAQLVSLQSLVSINLNRVNCIKSYTIYFLKYYQHIYNKLLEYGMLLANIEIRLGILNLQFTKLFMMYHTVRWHPPQIFIVWKFEFESLHYNTTHIKYMLHI